MVLKRRGPSPILRHHRFDFSSSSSCSSQSTHSSIFCLAGLFSYSTQLRRASRRARRPATAAAAAASEELEAEKLKLRAATLRLEAERAELELERESLAATASTSSLTASLPARPPLRRRRSRTRPCFRCFGARRGEGMSWMPGGWGASGGSLELRVDVRLTLNPCRARTEGVVGRAEETRASAPRTHAPGCSRIPLAPPSSNNGGLSTRPWWWRDWCWTKASQLFWTWPRRMARSLRWRATSTSRAGGCPAAAVLTEQRWPPTPLPPTPPPPTREPPARPRRRGQHQPAGDAPRAPQPRDERGGEGEGEAAAGLRESSRRRREDSNGGSGSVAVP